ncbi:hypothetical protein SAMN04244579_04574, partial [Azotobacter beijerinckii]
ADRQIGHQVEVGIVDLQACEDAYESERTSWRCSSAAWNRRIANSFPRAGRLPPTTWRFRSEAVTRGCSSRCQWSTGPPGPTIRPAHWRRWPPASAAPRWISPRPESMPRWLAPMSRSFSGVGMAVLLLWCTWGSLLGRGGFPVGRGYGGEGVAGYAGRAGTLSPLACLPVRGGYASLGLQITRTDCALCRVAMEPGVPMEPG